MSEAAELAHARMNSLSELRQDVADLTRAVNKLAAVVDEAYPTWEEVNAIVRKSQNVNAKRKTATIYAAVIVFALASLLSSFHVHECMTDPPPEATRTYVCDVIAPTFAHGAEESWPTLANVAGWTGYGSLVIVSVLGFVRARPTKEDEEDEA